MAKKWKAGDRAVVTLQDDAYLGRKGLVISNLKNGLLLEFEDKTRRIYIEEDVKRV
jgi:hypothetical protein